METSNAALELGATMECAVVPTASGCCSLAAGGWMGLMERGVAPLAQQIICAYPSKMLGK